MDNQEDEFWRNNKEYRIEQRFLDYLALNPPTPEEAERSRKAAEASQAQYEQEQARMKLEEPSKFLRQSAYRESSVPLFSSFAEAVAGLDIRELEAYQWKAPRDAKPGTAELLEQLRPWALLTYENYDHGFYYPEVIVTFKGGGYLAYDAEYSTFPEWVDMLVEDNHPYLAELLASIEEVKTAPASE